jgi:protein-S-isoprenylcysteine O-methyltransferase Ste14
VLTIAHYRFRQSEHDPAEVLSSPFCPSSWHAGNSPHLSITPITLFGVLLMAFGTFVRLQSYEALGTLFTFDLCIKPEHRLVTSGPYSFVRHPAYLGSLCLTVGLTFIGLTRGSWIIECAVGSHRTGAMLVTQCAWISWWVYTAGVGYTRAVAEDEQMRSRFGEEWERYAMRVRSWFVPGLV